MNRKQYMKSQMDKEKVVLTPQESETYLQTICRRFKRHKLAMVSCVLLAFLVLAAVVVPFFYPYDPAETVGAFSQAPSMQHWLGTDQIGRDQLSRLLHGTRISLLVGIMAAGVSTVVGVVLGLISGFFGGVVDMVIMRITDAIMSFPYVLLVLVAASIFEPGLWTIIFILGLVDWPGVARLVRGNVLSLRESNFVKSSQLSGMPRRYLLFSDILPNTIAPVLVYATSVVALSILDEAALSFLGMGIQLPTPSLGNMLNGAENLSILTGKPWLWVPPGLVIILLVVAINFIGDALRDALDPTST